MDVKKIKRFMKEYGLTCDEVSQEIMYSRPTLMKDLRSKEPLEGRKRMAYKNGLKNLFKKKIALYEKGLEEWEKYSKS